MKKNNDGITEEEMIQLETFQNYLLQSRNILAVVGAGLSAASGLSTFRGTGGLWRNYSPIDLATPDAFDMDPGLVWQFYSSRRYQAMKAKPNKGHFALAELSRRRPSTFLTLTQNVDGLSSRAKHEKNTILELHGSLFTLKCTSFFCNYSHEDNREHPLTPALANCEDEFPQKRKQEQPEPDDQSQHQSKRRKLNEPINKDLEDAKAISSSNVSSNVSSPDFKPVQTIPERDLPHCPECKEGLLRPGVVWFGESLPLKVMDAADDFLMTHRIDLVLVIGTSGTVWPAMGYIERAQRKGAKVAVFNTEIDNLEKLKKKGDWGFLGDASKWLPVALEPVIGSEYLPRNWKKF
ncbi:hypothetical protein WICMUC_003787 [Wickerhamomyces mucosus]|uniref:Deacetylase sirtuin-type domain-containing protein n=1 Tax=Wickerhamomyces mucosus TaxID=1378264 RepID=A0A9P8PK57_9ASCO|nr:hypothetical protein WICMUC_003787 [Wickerhamomyces mucosus]